MTVLIERDMLIVDDDHGQEPVNLGTTTERTESDEGEGTAVLRRTAKGTARRLAFGFVWQAT